MKRQVVVIGLGQFGMSVAHALSGRGVEVLAVDVDEERVQTASAFVAEAATLDATHGDSLARISPERRDVTLCAIGDQAKEDSIICTALLRQMGSPRIIARANDDVHARILTLVGAHAIVNPEREFGDRFATQLLHEGIRGELPLGKGVVISDVAVPASFVGRTLDELRLPKSHGVTVVAVRNGKSGAVVLPSKDITLSADDVLVVVSEEGAVARMMERS